jgi:hypothetical protein
MNEEIEEVFEENNDNEKEELKIDISVSESEINLPPPKRNETIEEVIRSYLSSHNLKETLKAFTAEAPTEISIVNEEYSNAISMSGLEEENQKLKLELERLKKENGFDMIFDMVDIFYEEKYERLLILFIKIIVFTKMNTKRLIRRKIN